MPREKRKKCLEQNRCEGAMRQQGNGIEGKGLPCSVAGHEGAVCLVAG